MIFCGSRRNVARFAKDVTIALKPNYVSITIIAPAKSAACYVYIVTDTLSEDIVAKKAWNFSWHPTNILHAQNIQAGLYLRG